MEANKAWKEGVTEIRIVVSTLLTAKGLGFIRKEDIEDIINPPTDIKCSLCGIIVIEKADKKIEVQEDKH